MISFGNYIPRVLDWASFKAMVASKYLSVQYDFDGNLYTVYGYDGPEVLVTYIWVEVPQNAGITQEQGDTSRADFETNYKPKANGPINAKTADGRSEVRNTTAKRTNNFNLRAISFYTACSGSVHNVNPVTDTSFNDIAYMMFDASGTLITDPTMSGSAVKTVVDWEPHYNYEIIGGFMDIPSDLKDGTSDQWYLAAIGVPDLPPQMYGSVPYINEVNLEAVTTQRIVSDGKAISYLPYKYAGYPTNKLRFIIKHPVGLQKRFQLFVEHFV